MKRKQIVTLEAHLSTPDALKIQVIPLYVLEQLDHLRQDQATIILLAGAFSGVSLDILVNWLSEEVPIFTHSSVLVFVLFMFITTILVWWAIILGRRINTEKRHIIDIHVSAKRS